MAIPDHVQRALEEYQAAALLARAKAGEFAGSLARRAADLASAGDPEAEPFVVRARSLAEDLASFAKSPLEQVPEGPIMVAIVYGPEDATHAMAVRKHLHSLRRYGTVTIPLQLVSAVADRTQVFLFILSPSVKRWSESADGTALRDRCSASGCLTVPIYWRDSDYREGFSYTGPNWLYSKMGMPSRGAVETQNQDEALAGISRGVRQALGL